MPDFSLVPVDYPPNFENVSYAPVEYDPFSADGVVQQAQAQQAQAQTQPAPQDLPQQPATGANQPVLKEPATGNGPDGPSGGPVGGTAGTDPNNPPSDQGGSSEPAPFGGFANPTLTESLVNQAKMNDQRRIVRADSSGKNGFEFGDREGPYEFVTTNTPLARYVTPDLKGHVFTEMSPFYVRQGPRFAIIDASPERPVTVTARVDGTFTISRP